MLTSFLRRRRDEWISNKCCRFTLYHGQAAMEIDGDARAIIVSTQVNDTPISSDYRLVAAASMR